MAVTRINNNQITDAQAGNVVVGVNAASKVQNYSITSQKIANNLVYGSDLTVSGNLTVNGQTTTIDTTITTIEDPVILLASTQTGSPTVDIGFIGERGTSNNIAFVWDESASEFVTAFTSTSETNTTITISSYSNFHTNDANIGGNAVINGTTSLVGNLVGAVNATGNITGGNLRTPGLVSAAGTITSASNINGANLIATTTVSASSLVGTTASLSGNITGGNVLTGGLISSTGNITSAANVTGGNLITSGILQAGSFSTSGNVTGGNLLTGGLVSATGTITSAANISGANVNATTIVSAPSHIGTIASLSGNVTGGNILTGGQVSAAANVTGGNIITTGNVNSNQGYFTGNVTVVGTFTSTSNIVANTSGIFYGNAVTGNDAIYAGLPTFTPLGTNVVAQFTGNVNSYSQINFENISNGNRASTDYIATADNGTDSTNYADFGINSSTFDDPVNYPGYGPNDSYVHNHGGNLILNPESSGKTIKLMVGGTANSNVIANVSSTGIAVVGVVSANGTVTGGNLATGGTVSATSNITGGNVLTGGLISATSTITSAANISGANVNATTIVSAPSYVGTTVSVSGNITGGNIATTGAVNAGTVSTTGNIFVAGNLTVQGNIQYTNVDDLRVEDPVIILGTGPNGTPLTADDGMDRGVYMEYYKSGAVGNAFMGWDNSTGNMIMASSVNFSGNNVVNVLTYGTLQAGNAYLQSSSVIGNVDGGNLRTAGLISATGNVNGGNLIAGTLVTGTSVTGTTISASANITGGNLLTGGLISATGTITSGANITGANILTGGLVSATGTITSAANISGANVNATTIVSSPSYIGTIASLSGNVTGGNVLTGGLVSAAANVTGGNILTGGFVSATGNVSGGNINLTGNIVDTGALTIITGSNGNIALTPNGTGIVTVSSAASITGNVTGGNLLTGGLVSATGAITSGANITGGNILTGGLISATGTITSAANVIGGNITTAGQVSATGNIQSAGIVIANGGRFGNLIVSENGITAGVGNIVYINQDQNDIDFGVRGDTVGNVFYVDAGTGTASFGTSTQTTNAIVAFNATNSILMPVGNTGQRPSTGVTGMVRFNSTSNALEVYDNSAWTTVGVPSFTVIADNQFNGDGSTVNFTLGSSQTTNSCIVSINGVVQIPTVAYSVSGTTLTFTEAPQSGDVIDVRQITTTTTVTAISNSSGNAVVSVSDTSNIVLITGQLSATGGIVGLSSDQISNGTSNVAVASSGGNVRVNIGGTSNVAVFSTTGLSITGDLSVTGNATLTGNILGDRIQNGTTQIDIQTQNGNANITVGGTSNVAVFASSGLFVTGLASITGNVTSGNIAATNHTGTTVSVTGNITGANINGAGTGLTGTAASLTVGTATVAGTVTTAAQPNITSVGTLTSLTSSGNIQGANIIATLDVYTPEIVKTGSNAVGNIGQSTNYFNTVFAQATSALYADLAEKYVADAAYPVGTVVCFGGSQEVTVTSADADTKVAGVVSTNPSYIMNAGLEAEHVATVALTGRVPTRVTGTVRKGDLMVSAGYGLARAEANPRVGTVIGKALADFNGQEGVIEVVVGRF